jgi:UDP-glucose 4-epimerase
LAHHINALLPAVLCEWLAGWDAPGWDGQRLIHVGSAAEYGAADGDLREDTPARPTTLYGQTKLAGTSALADRCTARGLPGLTARLFTVYGPGEHAGRLLPSLLTCARSGESLPLTAGLQQRDFTYVEDVAEGLLRLGLSHGEPGAIVNLATGRLTAVREFVETAAEILSLPAGRLQFDALPVRPDEMQHDPVNVNRLYQRTGWRPETTIHDGILKTTKH